MNRLRIPVATYRLQFNKEFPFSRAGKLVPYLNALGITDVYSSPLFQAQRGSTHGYDVTDPKRLNLELGGKDEFDHFAATLKYFEMGLLMDIVPNHMAASIENPWWLDVLRNGIESPYAGYFDINWATSQPGLKNKVLLPVLGAPYGEVLEKQELSLIFDQNGFWISYYEKSWPVSPKSYSPILGRHIKALDKEGPGVRQLFNLIEEQAFETRSAGALEELWQLYNSNTQVKAYMDNVMQEINGTKGNPCSFNSMHQLMEGQAYRLAYWRVANQQINYRRFFNVNDKVSVRVERESVFSATHALIVKLAKAGLVTGLRIDHIDGLYDPHEYLRRLQVSLSSEEGFYVVVEKILGKDEELRADWPVYGTTGYDFMNTVNRLFVDRHESTALDRIYERACGFDPDFDEIVYAQKRWVMAQLFTVEIENLTRELQLIAEQERHARDFTFTQLEHGLREIIACFPVYRTYTRGLKVTEKARKSIEQAIEEAVREYPDIGPTCDWLRRVLLLDFPEYLAPEQKKEWLRFVMRWQQFTGPIMAKGFEDTALYVYNQLVSLNEVGGDPRDTGISVPEFHRRNLKRQERWPHTLNATSTHDSKRSEDVRARINVLSEIPFIWSQHLKKWRRWNKTRKMVLNGQHVPGGNAELLIYQTLLGAWPLNKKELPEFKERLEDYLIKSAREANVYTSWLYTNNDYEDALIEFTKSILKTSEENLFLQDFLGFQRIIAFYGALGSLAQVLLKTMSPGVPDFYQGTELWNLSLVDPDNRRPVDFKARAVMLEELQRQEKGNIRELAGQLVDCWDDGRVKMFVTYKALHFRRDWPDLFSRGEYIPVKGNGTYSGYICAFARRFDNVWAMVVVPRLMARFMSVKQAQQGEINSLAIELPLGETWADNYLIVPEHAPARWRNIFTGDPLTTENNDALRGLSLSRVFQDLPVALLVGE
ncbi:MAG: malto-oligosyltrehalose synthase [Firmicutes bacterium]|nr:malto-oligosyltrehalose synthase [Bacillota bacterium]